MHVQTAKCATGRAVYVRAINPTGVVVNVSAMGQTLTVQLVVMYVQGDVPVQATNVSVRAVDRIGVKVAV